MALRIDPRTVIKGSLCNREKGRIRGELWLRGVSQPVQLDLKGNPHRDLAGRTLAFGNPESTPDGPAVASDFSLAPDQNGTTGDITASRKVRVPTVSGEERRRCLEEKREIPTVWKNSIYLEWFSIRNGRVVLEAPGFECEISEPAWIMTDADEIDAHRAAQDGLVSFLDTICEVVAESDDDDDDDESEGEGTPFALEDETDDAAMDEFAWEKFMKERDRKTDRLMEIYDKFGHGPDGERKIAELMGWNLPEEAFERPSKTREEKEKGDGTSSDESEPQTYKDPPPRRSRRAHNPLSERVRILFLKFDRRSQDPGTPVFEMCSQLMLLSAKLAGALDRLEGEDDDDDDDDDARYQPDPGFTIACLKRCLPILDDALKAATEAGDQEETIAELFGVRDGILKRMADLRSKN